MYLKREEAEIQHRIDALRLIKELRKKKKSNSDILKLAKESFNINKRFVDGVLYQGIKTRPRPPKDFISFDEFREEQE